MSRFIERSSQFETEEFTIAATPEAFRILSDGLYSNKIRAIIRELSTNALDSQKLMGTDKPFDVHLPSYDEPWFSVRDYGVGMSDEQVRNLYRTYFGTDKHGDNTTTGCLGLGSKSPLSKCRAFNVTCWHGGEKRSYIVAINENGTPTVNCLVNQTCPTDETGVEVKLAVSTSDIIEYQRQANAVFYFFAKKDRPRLIGDIIPQIEDRTPVLQGDGWRIYNNNYGKPVAIQANVAYPIDKDKIRNITSAQREILLCDMEIDFENGSLSFTPSREHLSYNQSTCVALVDKLSDIQAEVNKSIEEALSKCPTLWEARVLAYSMFWSRRGNMNVMCSQNWLAKIADKKHLTWNGEKVYGKRLSFGDIAGVQAWSFKKSEKSSGYWSTSTYSVSRSDRTEFIPLEKVEWYEIDIPRGSYSRCHYAVQQNIDRVIYLVKFENKAAKKEFCERMGLGGHEFTPVSSLPKPPSKTASKGKVSKSSSIAYKHNARNDYGSRMYSFWNPTEVDFDDEEGGVYVEMTHHKVIDRNGEPRHPAIIGDILMWLSSIGHKDCTSVIGVRKSVVKKFKDSDDWVNIFDYVYDLMSREVHHNGMGQIIVDAQEYCNQMSVNNIWSNLFATISVPRNSSMEKFKVAFQYMETQYNSCKCYADYIRLCDMVGVKLSCYSPTYDYMHKLDTALNDYPMLNHIYNILFLRYFSCHKFTHEQAVAIQDYLELVENSHLTLAAAVV